MSIDSQLKNRRSSQHTKIMPPISNSDMFYLYRAEYACFLTPYNHEGLLMNLQVEDEYKKGNVEVAYRECDELHQGPHLPFYYRGHYHVLRSHGDEDPVSTTHLPCLL